MNDMLIERPLHAFGGSLLDRSLIGSLGTSSQVATPGTSVIIGLTDS